MLIVLKVRPESFPTALPISVSCFLRFIDKISSLDGVSIRSKGLNVKKKTYKMWGNSFQLFRRQQGERKERKRDSDGPADP